MDHRALVPLITRDSSRHFGLGRNSSSCRESAAAATGLGPRTPGRQPDRPRGSVPLPRGGTHADGCEAGWRRSLLKGRPGPPAGRLPAAIAGCPPCAAMRPDVKPARRDFGGDVTSTRQRCKPYVIARLARLAGEPDSHHDDTPAIGVETGRNISDACFGTKMRVFCSCSCSLPRCQSWLPTRLSHTASALHTRCSAQTPVKHQPVCAGLASFARRD